MLAQRCCCGCERSGTRDRVYKTHHCLCETVLTPAWPSLRTREREHTADAMNDCRTGHGGASTGTWDAYECRLGSSSRARWGRATRAAIAMGPSLERSLRRRHTRRHTRSQHDWTQPCSSNPSTPSTSRVEVGQPLRCATDQELSFAGDSACGQSHAHS